MDSPTRCLSSSTLESRHPPTSHTVESMRVSNAGLMADRYGSSIGRGLQPSHKAQPAARWMCLMPTTEQLILEAGVVY
jgi:hypothetical protein